MLTKFWGLGIGTPVFCRSRFFVIYFFWPKLGNEQALSPIRVCLKVSLLGSRAQGGVHAGVPPGTLPGLVPRGTFRDMIPRIWYVKETFLPISNIMGWKLEDQLLVRFDVFVCFKTDEHHTTDCKITGTCYLEQTKGPARKSPVVRRIGLPKSKDFKMLRQTIY